MLFRSINVKSVLANLARDTLIFGQRVDRKRTASFDIDRAVGHIDLKELIRATRSFNDIPVLPVDRPRKPQGQSDYQVFFLPTNFGNLFRFKPGDFLNGLGFVDVTFRPPPPIQFWS